MAHRDRSVPSVVCHLLSHLILLASSPFSFLLLAVHPASSEMTLTTEEPCCFCVTVTSHKPARCALHRGAPRTAPHTTHSATVLHTPSARGTRTRMLLSAVSVVLWSLWPVSWSPPIPSEFTTLNTFNYPIPICARARATRRRCARWPDGPRMGIGSPTPHTRTSDKNK